MKIEQIVGEPGIAAFVADAAAATHVANALASSAAAREVVTHTELGGETALVRATGDAAALRACFDVAAVESLYVTSTRSLLRHRVRWPIGRPTPGVGTIYGVRRHPDLTAVQFHEHWEHSHGPVALAHHLGMWDYRQVSVVDTVRGPHLDGIAVVQWPTDEDRRTRFFDDADGAAVVSADARMFTDASHLHHHLMSEQLLKVAPLPDTGTVEMTDHRSLELPIAPAALWATVGDFGAILDWWPSGVIGCVVDDMAQPTQRVLSRADGSTVTERLVRHHPEDRMLVLEVVAGFPTAVRHYTCRYEVRELDDGTCRLDWQPRATVEAAHRSTFDDLVDAGWDQVAAGLRAHV